MPERWTISLSKKTGNPMQVWPAGKVPEFIANFEWNEYVEVMRVPKPMEAIIVPRMSLESIVGGLGTEFERNMHLDIVKSCLVLPE
jgi:hypothetical protein